MTDIKKTKPEDRHPPPMETPPRVPPRLEGVVKNVGIKPKKKPKKETVVIKSNHDQPKEQ